MFYQEALPVCYLLSLANSLLTIRDKYQRKLTAMFECQINNSLPLARNKCFFMWGAYFCMGTYKCDVVVV